MKKLSMICSVMLALCVAAVIGTLCVLSGDKNRVSEPTIEIETYLELASALPDEAEKTEEKRVVVQDNDQVVISNSGSYRLSGSVEGAVIRVTADKDQDEVQLILDNLNITNENFPAIYIESAGKVTITTTADSSNSLTVTGEFISDGDVNTDGVIFSRSDLLLEGEGILNIDSTYNGIVCKDDLEITAGTYNIKSVKDSIEVKDTIDISGGEFNIETEKDGINCSNNDDVVCEVHISDGTFNINAGKKGIQVDAIVTIDGGTFSIVANEGIEATYVLINDGDIDIYAYDDGINATKVSQAYDVVIEINGGNVNVEAGPGDTDALDANGSLYINGGNVTITAQSAFDYDFLGELNGGTVFVNGEQVYELTPSMMGGSHGGKGGDRGGSPGGPGFGEEMGW